MNLPQNHRVEFREVASERLPPRSDRGCRRARANQGQALRVAAKGPGAVRVSPRREPKGVSARLKNFGEAKFCVQKNGSLQTEQSSRQVRCRIIGLIGRVDACHQVPIGLGYVAFINMVDPQAAPIRRGRLFLSIIIVIMLLLVAAISFAMTA